MARLLTNITDQTNQLHTIIFKEFEVSLNMLFLPVVEQWVFSCAYKDFRINGVKMSCGTPHLLSQNQPFDFVIVDKARAGIDPRYRDDFSTGRCQLYFLDDDDMREIRGGASVPL